MSRQYNLYTIYRDAPETPRPIADSRNYPSPCIRVVPGPGGIDSGGIDRFDRSSLAVLYVDAARTGLFLIAQALSGRTVWLPSFHCPAMIEPFIAGGCSIAFYPVSSSLTADYSTLACSIQRDDLVVGVRFFGFDCGLDDLSCLCERHGAILVEDLAHSPYTESFCGSLAVTSLSKFFPIENGAELLLNANCSFRNEISRLYQKLPSPTNSRARRMLERIMRHLRVNRIRTAQFRYFFPQSMYRGLRRRDRLTLLRSNQSGAATKRQQNFSMLADALARSPLGRPLFLNVPPNVVPYALPFLMKLPSTFDHLRNCGIEVLRWEEMVATGCKVSERYRQCLVQLPVHQGLTSKDLQLIVAALESDRGFS